MRVASRPSNSATSSWTAMVTHSAWSSTPATLWTPLRWVPLGGRNKVMGALGREGWRGVRIKEEVVRVGCWLGWSEFINFGRWDVDWEGERIFVKDGRLTRRERESLRMMGGLGGRENLWEGWEVDWEGERIFKKDGRLTGRERKSLRRMGGWLEGREFSCSVMMMMMSWCLMSSDVSWHIRDKLWPMPKHGSINLYVHGNQKAR